MKKFRLLKMQSEIRSLQKEEENASVQGIKANDSDNDSDAEVVERTKKYLTDEAGIIIVKQRKIPRQKFDIKLNFDVDSNVQGEKQLSYKIGSADGLNFVEEQETKPEGATQDDQFTWKALTSIKDGQASITVQNEYGRSDEKEKSQSLASQIQHLDTIELIVNDAERKRTVLEKEQIYRENFGGYAIDSASLPLLSALLASDESKIGDEEFEEETIEDGKLVLYLTEKQLAQLLRQRAIVVTKSNKKVLVKENRTEPTVPYVIEHQKPATESGVQAQAPQTTSTISSSANVIRIY
jgi:hypothetical protein